LYVLDLITFTTYLILVEALLSELDSTALTIFCNYLIYFYYANYST